MFYRVQPSAGAGPGSDAPGLCQLQPCDRCGPASSSTHLEVVLAGEWLGLRSAAAGDRFLQATKRGAARLAFHAGNLGTWEQWRLAEGGAAALAAAWDASAPVLLQNRRLPQVQLRVCLVRVGSYVPAGPAGSLTPRSLCEAGPAATMERDALRRISDVVVQEWFAYVDKEKTRRLEVEGRLAELAGTTAELRAWATNKVDAQKWAEFFFHVRFGRVKRGDGVHKHARARVCMCARAPPRSPCMVDRRPRPALGLRPVPQPDSPPPGPGSRWRRCRRRRTSTWASCWRRSSGAARS